MRIALFLLLLFPLQSLAELKIIGETKVGQYKIVRLQAKDYPDKSALIWRWDKKKLDGGKNGDRLWLTGPPGQYTIECMSITLDKEGKTQVEEAEAVVTIGESPNPDPKPPEPKPPEPKPDASILGKGTKVLIIYESGDLTKYPAAQLTALHSKTVRDYLNSKCTGGATKDWRVWDKDVDASKEEKHWQDGLKRERKSTPWIIISTEKGSYEGPFPADVTKTLDLLKKYMEVSVTKIKPVVRSR